MAAHPSSGDWGVVYHPLDMAEAQIAARLDDAGISAYVRQESSSTALPVDFGLFGQIDLMVPVDQEDAAIRVLIDAGMLEEDDS